MPNKGNILIDQGSARSKTLSRSESSTLESRFGGVLYRHLAALSCSLLLSSWSATATAQQADWQVFQARAYAGDVSSQIRLGTSYLQSDQSPRDRTSGLAWVIVAAASGDPSAIKIRQKVFSKVRPKTGMAAEAIAFRILRSVKAPRDADGSASSMTPFDLVYLSGTGSAAKVSDFIESGANVNVVAPDGMTPLLASLQAGRYDIAKMLLAAGAKTEVTSEAGLTPLAQAVEREDIVSIALLVGHGASVFAPDANGIPLFQSRIPEKARRFLEIETRDMTRDEVREVQSRLKAAGFKPGTIDGLIGSKTWTAFDAFAEANGLERKIRNPNAALKAVRTFIPTADYREEIAEAMRSAKAPARKVARRPQEPTKTAAEIFFGQNFSGGISY